MFLERMSGSLSLSVLCPKCPAFLEARIHTPECNHLVHKGTEMGSPLRAARGVRGKKRPLPAASLLVQGHSLPLSTSPFSQLKRTQTIALTKLLKFDDRGKRWM